VVANDGKPRDKAKSYWAIWWGFTIALLFLVAATMSFSLNTHDVGRTTTVSYGALSQDRMTAHPR